VNRSLEQAGVEVSSNGQYLVATSTKRVWVINRELQPTLKYESRFILRGLPTIQNNSELTVLEYNFDSDQEMDTCVIGF
jgi:hypothetical protein